MMSLKKIKCDVQRNIQVEDGKKNAEEDMVEGRRWRSERNGNQNLE